MVKFDAELTALTARWITNWRRIDTDLGITYFVNRQALPSLNRWQVVISANGCTTNAFVAQEEDEQLWTGADDIPFTAIGTCAGDSPILTLNAESFKTQAAAVVEYPDVQLWEWDF